MPGLLVERLGTDAGGRTPGAEAAGFGAPAGTAPGMPTIIARQSSQYSTSRTGRTHVEHMALPQFRQYPTASTSEWTAHFMAFSSRQSSRSERGIAQPVPADSGRVRRHGSAVWARTDLCCLCGPVSRENSAE